MEDVINSQTSEDFEKRNEVFREEEVDEDWVAKLEESLKSCSTEKCSIKVLIKFFVWNGCRLIAFEFFQEKQFLSLIQLI